MCSRRIIIKKRYYFLTLSFNWEQVKKRAEILTPYVAFFFFFFLVFFNSLNNLIYFAWVNAVNKLDSFSENGSCVQFALFRIFCFMKLRKYKIVFNLFWFIFVLSWYFLFRYFLIYFPIEKSQIKIFYLLLYFVLFYFIFFYLQQTNEKIISL